MIDFIGVSRGTFPLLRGSGQVRILSGAPNSMTYIMQVGQRDKNVIRPRFAQTRNSGDDMKKLFFAAAFLLAGHAHAAQPCQWPENYGYVRYITPNPVSNSVRFALSGGRTAAMGGVYNLLVPSGNPARLELFRQAMDLIKDAHARGTMISVETTDVYCSVATTEPPNVKFVTTQVRIR